MTALEKRDQVTANIPTYGNRGIRRARTFLLLTTALWEVAIVEEGSTPFIEVVDGGRLELPRGSALVGRADDADLRLPSPEVSARHAWLRRDERTTWVNDANSTNGTWINGRRLVSGRERELRHGDRLEFGPVTAVYRDPARSGRDLRTQVRQRPVPGTSYGDVSAGTFNHAGRDVNNSYDQRQHHQYEFTTPEGEVFNELATGRGAGRALMILGQLLSLAGFCIWIFVIFRFITAIPTSGPTAEFSPPELLGPPVFDGVPLGVVGFGMVILGGVVSYVGTVMAKSARERRKGRNR